MATMAQPFAASTTTPPSADQRGQIAGLPSAPARVSAVQVRTASPADALQALAAKRNIQLEEFDTAGLPENLRDGYFGHYLETKDGLRLLVFPTGQDPAERLHVARILLAKAEVPA